MTRSFFVAMAFTLLTVGTAYADGVVPNSAAGVEGDGTFALTSTTATGRTYQMTIDAGQLTALVGTNISGMQWRLNGAATVPWPPANASYAFWDIFIGPGVDPSAMSNTFASNFTASATQVRNGPLSFTAGSFPSGGSPNTFGPTLPFTSNYFYSGGDLAIEMRFAAQTGTTTTSPFDAVAASGGPGNGWGVGFAARWTGNATGTTGTNGNFLVTNLITQAAVPEPSTIVLASLAIAPLAFWKKLRRQRRLRRRK